MSGAETVREAEAFLGPLLRCIETDKDGAKLVVAEDFLKRADIPRSDIHGAWKALESLLADPDVSNADLKGMLNRIDIGWKFESPFGANAIAAREHLEAARDALQTWIEKA